MTVLNSESETAKSDKVYIKVDSEKHLIVLNESTGKEEKIFLIEI